MAVNPQQLEGGSTNNNGSETNTSSIDELTGLSALTRGAVEVILFQTLQRHIEPVFEPFIRRVVKEEIGLAQAQQKLLTITKENPANKASTSAPNKSKLQFRNKISLPVLTGKEVLGENQKPLELVLIDALTGQIVNIGSKSTAKLEILVLEDGDDDNLTFEEFQKRIVSEKEGARILQGNTCLQLKDGIGFVGKISFTHGSKWTKSGRYRLGARALMAGVEVAWTEAFLIKDRRSILYKKHYPPSLLDRVYHLEQISIKGVYYKRLKDAQVETVKDLLTLIYTNPEQLECILKLKASSKIWGDIVRHAQTSDGMFLYLDPSSEGKSGVVLHATLELKGLIVDFHRYTPVDQLSGKQKKDALSLVKFASENLELLHAIKDEASLKEFLQSDMSFTNQITDGPPSPSSHATDSSFDLTEALDNLDNMNSDTGQSLNPQTPTVTIISQSERGKEQVSDISFHSFYPESPNEPNFWQIYTPEFHIDEYLHHILNNGSNNELHSESDPANSETEAVIMATQTVSVCATAQTRWTKVSKLLRRLSVRERIGSLDEVQAQKKQRCC